MKKKGFTLIELLAVIVILAIIALIIVPVVANIIESARFGAAKDSVLEYVHAANQYGALSLAGTDEGLTIDGSLESGVDDAELEKIKYSGTKFDYIYMEFDESNNVTSGSFCINGYSIDYYNGDVERTIGYCNEQAGLYSMDNKLVASWEDLVNKNGLDITTNLSNPMATSSTTTSGGYVMKSLLGDDQGKLVLPNDITKIGMFQFSSCSNIVELKMSNNVTEIGIGAFWNASNLTKINLSTNLNSISNMAFVNTSLKSITIPGNIKAIASQSFSNSKLEKIVLSEGLETIGMHSFLKNKIKNVIIPSTVKTIGQSAFEDNELKSVTLNEGLEDIDPSVFYNNNLTTITIPSTVKNISSAAFLHNELTEVIIKGKSSPTEFESYYPAAIWGWAEGYDDSYIKWNQ